MNFEWKLPKDGKSTFEEKVHNLACFEIVLNIGFGINQGLVSPLPSQF